MKPNGSVSYTGHCLLGLLKNDYPNLAAEPFCLINVFMGCMFNFYQDKNRESSQTSHTEPLLSILIKMIYLKKETCRIKVKV